MIIRNHNINYSMQQNLQRINMQNIVKINKIYEFFKVLFIAQISNSQFFLNSELLNIIKNNKLYLNNMTFFIKQNPFSIFAFPYSCFIFFQKFSKNRVTNPKILEFIKISFLQALTMRKFNNSLEFCEDFSFYQIQQHTYQTALILILLYFKISNQLDQKKYLILLCNKTTIKYILKSILLAPVSFGFYSGMPRFNIHNFYEFSLNYLKFVLKYLFANIDTAIIVTQI